MNRVFRTGFIITMALCVSAAMRAQQRSQTPPPLPAAPPAPRVAPAPRAVPLPPPTPLPDEFLDEEQPVIAPVAPEPPEPLEPPEPVEAQEPYELPEPPEPPEPAIAEVVGGVIGGVVGGVIGGVPGGVAPLSPMPPEPPEPAFPSMDFGPMAFALQATPRPARSEDADRYYERGQHDLERNRWDDALNDFGEVVSRGGSRADGALYWKAYALNKLGRREEALASIGELRKSHPGSRWLDDAQALEIEVKQEAGKPVNPESAGDEELKLMALNSFMNSDPERALPLLEKLLHSSQSPKIKERALFVLTQSGSSKARQLVVEAAKGGSNPDLQMKAVHYLGVMGGSRELGEVYAVTLDPEVKRAVLHGLMVAGAKEQLFTAAKSEKNADLRQQAIHWLGTMGAEPELWQLYQAEPSMELKRSIAHALFVGGKTDKLLEIARTAKEPEIRLDAIHWLGASGSERAGDVLAGMYPNEADPNVKKQIIHALFIQSNGKALVEIARKENNIELKKEIVHRLSLMKSKEGTDYLLELLNK